nr:MAG TPA: hypothetical protein [Caudoviricetes sp.]
MSTLFFIFLTKKKISCKTHEISIFNFIFLLYTSS